MISNRELKDEIEQLNEQNQYLTEELRSIKELLTKQSTNNDKQSGANNNSMGNDNQNANSTNTNSSNGGDKNNNQDHGLSAIAKDFSMLKDLTNQLEAKMQSYVCSKSSGNSTLTNEDAINLILAVMNGMIDWTMEMVTKTNNSQ
jgi:hypothetical protein